MKGTGTYSFDWEVKAVRAQYLDYKAVRPWADRRVANPALSEDSAWQARQREVAASNARARALEAAAVNGLEP